MPDGAGGAFVVWQDDRGTGVDLYAQRMNGNGQPLWPEAGVAVCTADGAQTNPVLISDGAGGCLSRGRIHARATSMSMSPA
jgi:hypothetical protein